MPNDVEKSLKLLCCAANILLRYLGEEGKKTPIKAAVSLCNPFDLVGFVLESFLVLFSKRVGKVNLWSFHHVSADLNLLRDNINTQAVAHQTGSAESAHRQ